MRLVIVALAACTKAPVEMPKISSSCGHAHNDEDNARPLHAALDSNFCSVEVDVHLVGDQLLVAHDLENTTPEKTLESLYLDPLSAASRELFLMIDVKSDAETTWAAIDQRLANYDLGPVRVVITGNAARTTIANASPRRACLDGRLSDLDANVDSELYPIISDKWVDHFTWVGGVEAIPPDQRIKLRMLADQAHAKGHRLRFWQTGDRTEMWQAELDAGVDLINTDDVAGLAAFLSDSRARTPPL